MSRTASQAGLFAGPRLRDLGLELAYRGDARPDELRVNLVIYVVVATNILVFFASDPAFLPPGPARWALGAVRVGYVALLVTALWKARRVQSAAARDLLHGAMSALVMVVATAIHATRPRGHFSYLPFDVATIFTTWALLAVSFRWQAALAALSVVASGVVLILFRDPLPPASALAVGMALLTAHVIGAVTSWHLHRARRTAWLDRREAERAWRAAEAASAEKSVFLGSVSHELLSPLAGVVASADALARRAGEPVDQATLDALRDEAAALHGLLADVLDLAKGEAVERAPEPLPTSVGSVLSDVHQSLGWRAAARGVALRRVVGAEVPDWLSFDGRRLRQVVLNLASNGLRVTERGEVVMTATTGPVEAGRVELRVEVRDSGPGIPAGQLPHVFQPFWQAPGQPAERRGGAGLGLAVAQRLVRQLGGRISVESTPGEGTAFTVVLPGVQVASTAAPAGSPAEASARAEAPLVEEAHTLAEVPHAGQAMALAERVGRQAREAGDAALERWAADVRLHAEALDASRLAQTLRRLLPRSG